jgi:hypothetical protein
MLKIKALTTAVFLLSSVFCYSQTYSFSKLTKKAKVQTASGYEEAIIETVNRTFKIAFEEPISQGTYKLFTLLQPGDYLRPGQDFYGLLQEQGYLKKGSKLFRKFLYSDTEREENVLVLIAEDYSMVVFFRKNDIVEEYTR